MSAKIAKILVPLDLTDNTTTTRLLESAIEQCQSLNADLTAMAVVPDIATGIDYRYAIRGETHGSADYNKAQVVADTLERLNQVVSEQTPEGMPVKTIVRHGTIYEQVLKVAEEIKATQIIVGARNPGLGDFLLGSNSARIVRHAKCSVNVIRL